MEHVLDEKIRGKITEEEMKSFSAEAARSIVIRYTIDGNSEDRRRDTTQEEADVLRRIIYGALLNIRSGRDIQATADAAEYIAMQFLPGAGNRYDEPHANSYDTIYLPIKKWVSLQQQRVNA